MITPPFTTLLESLSPGPDRREPKLTFIDDDDRETPRTLSSIRDAAIAFAHRLRAAGVEKGDRVPLILPTSQEFVIAYFGILFAGAWPAPLGLPGGFGDLENFTRRVSLIGKYLGAKHVVTNAGLKDYAIAGIEGATFVDAALTLTTEPAPDTGVLPQMSKDDIALLQCTSGSTGVPKGVMLSHENLLVNATQIGLAVDVRPSDVVVTWLPLNHDMGIIGCVLFAITCGIDLVLLSPSKFLRRPSAWLKAISKHKGSLSPAPNFAYGYLTARVKPDELAGCDLSTWRVAFCGAEPIDCDTLLKFQHTFARWGLPDNIVLPCYGLAEASLAVTFHFHGRPIRYDVLDREQLAQGRVKFASRDSVRDLMNIFSTSVVSCGVPLEDTQVRVVDADGKVLTDLRAGRIQVKGPSVMQGYYGLPEKTAEVLADGWLDTGDLGYTRKRELYITGREKDVIIIRGKCYVPTDFEWAAAEVEGVREGAVVAFGVFDAVRGTELLHIVAEAESQDEAVRAKLRDAVTAHVAKKSGLRPDVVHFVRRYAIPKTTSGKLQRAKTKQAFLEERPSRTWRVF